MFMQPQHPQKVYVLPTKEDVAKRIAAGWWGQKKINGFRCQTHIGVKGDTTYFTRQGIEHTRTVPDEITEQLLANLKPTKGYTVIDAEWQQQLQKLFIFDIYRLDGQLLKRLNFADRYKILKEELFFLAPNIEFLPVYKSVRHCMQVLESEKPEIEGLVFRDPTDPGWHNDAIVRCLIDK